MKIKFKWIGGATFILTINDKLKIAVDPVLCKKGSVQDYFWFKSKRLENPVYDESDFSNIDLWLITHNHEDHLDDIGMTQIKNESTIISNKNSIKKLKKNGIKNPVLLNWKQSVIYKIKDLKIEIEAIPAIHGINPLSALLAGKVNGYFLTVSSKNEIFRIYITGDTVYKNKIIHTLKNKEVDLMIPNMGAAKQGSWIMTLTLNTKMLKKMISKLQPKLIIPVHYGTFEHYVEPVEKIKKINDKKIVFVKVGQSLKLDLNKTV